VHGDGNQSSKTSCSGVKFVVDWVSGCQWEPDLWSGVTVYGQAGEFGVGVYRWWPDDYIWATITLQRRLRSGLEGHAGSALGSGGGRT
jgi:hypothetical protein